MNFRAFFRNCAKARAWCPSLADRFKYLVWLYNRTPRLLLNRGLRIQFAFELPLGSLALNVRCNRGSDAFIFSEVFEHRYYELPLPVAPDTILDLGANIGLTALFFSRTYPKAKIACVEPIAENLISMKANLRENGGNAVVLAKAITINDGPVVMQRSDRDYGHKVQGIQFGRQLEGETVRVPGISMPSLISELGWGRIGLLKVDIEGYEGLLLRQNCAWLDKVDALCIECHEGFGKRELCEVAKDHDFLPPLSLPGISMIVRTQQKPAPR